jgi:hypothetical protein
MVAGRDENSDGMCAFKQRTQKLASIRGHAIVFEQIATAADHVNPLVHGEVDALCQRIAQGLPSLPTDFWFRPREG